MLTVNATTEFHAQFGEDRVLWNLFRQRNHGYFVEVGAYDGRSLSNTCFLESIGWKGMLVEPIAPLARLAAQSRPGSLVFAAACGARDEPKPVTFTIANNVPVLSFLEADEEHVERCKREGAELVEIKVTVRSLDSLLRSARERQMKTMHANPAGAAAGGAAQHVGPWKPGYGWMIDVVSIDTEGAELAVLDGFDLDRFRPRILILENDRPAGAAIEPYLDRRGYRRFHRQVINDFYIRKDDPAHDLDFDACNEKAD